MGPWPAVVAPGDGIFFDTDVMFVSSDAAVTSAEVSVRVQVEVEGGDAEGWEVFFPGHPRTVEGGGRFSRTVPLASSTNWTRVAIAVRAPPRERARRELARLIVSAETTNLASNADSTVFLGPFPLVPDAP